MTPILRRAGFSKLPPPLFLCSFTNVGEVGSVLGRSYASLGSGVCPNCIEHKLHCFFPAQAAAPFERAPGVEVDSKLERSKQAPPPFAANRPTLGEQVADLPEVGHYRTLE